MEYKRMWAMIIFVAALVVLYGSFILVYWRYHPPSISQLLGTIAGIILGLFVCRYLQQAWDPVHLRPTNPEGQQSAGCWLPVAGIGGIILSRMVITLFGANTQEVLAGVSLAFSTVVIGYMLIRVWRHRLRRE